MKTLILAAVALTFATAAPHSSAWADMYSHHQYNDDTRVWLMPAPQQPQPNNWQQFQPSAPYNQPRRFDETPVQPQYQPQPCRLINGMMVCQ